MLVEIQQSATSAPVIVLCCHGQGALFAKSPTITAVRVVDPRNGAKGSQPHDKSVMWKTHLAMQLVNHPELNKAQVKIVLDAISLSTPEFFGAANTTYANKTRANDALESLIQRAVAAFPNEQAAQLFASISNATQEQDSLKIYYDLSVLSLRKRRAAFRNAEPTTKAILWRTHLALFLVKRELSDWQKEVVWAAMSLATTDYFRIKPTASDWEMKVRKPTYWLEQQIFNAFTLDDAAKMFGTLGDDGEFARSSALVLLKNITYKPLSNSGPFKEWAHSRGSQQDMELERSNCSCSTESDYCSLTSACSGSNCSPTQSGCGTLWRYPCTGACQ
jgi:hypothetical protein